MKPLMKYMILSCLIFSLTLTAVVTVQAADQFNLAPGARGKLCLTCHEGFAETMQKKKYPYSLG